MSFSYIRNSSPGTKITFAVVLLICFFVFFSFSGFLLAMTLYKISMTELMTLLSDLQNTDQTHILKFMQIYQATGIFIVSPLCIVWLLEYHPLRYLYAQNAPTSKNILLVMAIILCILPLVNFLAWLNNAVEFPSCLTSLESWMRSKEQTAEDLTRLFLTMNSRSDLWINILMISVIPALGEELLFRGLLQRLFCDFFKNIHIAIITSAILFSAIHLQFFGFFPRMMLGLIFGYMLAWSENFWLPVIAHFSNNFMAVLAHYFLSEEQITKNIDHFGIEPQTAIWTVLSTVLVLFLMYQLKCNNRTKTC